MRIHSLKSLTFQQYQSSHFHFSTLQKLSLSNNAKTFTFYQCKNLLLSNNVKTFTFQQCDNFHFQTMWKLSLSNNAKTPTFKQLKTFVISNNVRLSPCNSAWASFQPPPSWSGQFSTPEQWLQEINSDMLSDSNSLTLITFDSLTLAGYSLKEVDQERFGRTLHYWRGWQCPPYC